MQEKGVVLIEEKSGGLKGGIMMLSDTEGEGVFQDHYFSLVNVGEEEVILLAMTPTLLHEKVFRGQVMAITLISVGEETFILPGLIAEVTISILYMIVCLD